VPFDVFATVNHYKTFIYGIQLYDIYFCKHLHTLITLLRLVDYLIMIALCFFILPFTYFYADESLESEDDMDLGFDLDDYDIEDEETNSSSIFSGKNRGKGGVCSGFLDRAYKSLRHTVSDFLPPARSIHS